MLSSHFEIATSYSHGITSAHSAISRREAVSSALEQSAFRIEVRHVLPDPVRWYGHFDIDLPVLDVRILPGHRRCRPAVAM